MTNTDMATPCWNTYLELLAAEIQMRSQPDYSNTDVYTKFTYVNCSQNCLSISTCYPYSLTKQPKFAKL